MTYDLGTGKQITINAHGGKTWITVSANGGGTSVCLGERGMEIAGEVIACERQNRKRKVGCPKD